MLLRGIKRLQWKLSLVFGLLSIFAVIVSSYMTYSKAYQEFEKSIGDKRQAVALTLARILDPEKLQRVRSLDDPYYRELRDLLAGLQKDFELSWISLYRYENGMILHIVDGAEPGYGFTLDYPILDTQKELEDAFSGQSTQTDKYVDSYGTWRSSFVPVMNGEGKVIAVVDVSESNRYLEKFRYETIVRTFQVTVWVTLLTLLISTLFSFSIASPITRLTWGTRAISEGKFATRIPDEGLADEIGSLIRAFNVMGEKLLESQKALEEKIFQLKENAEHLKKTNEALDRKIQEMTSLQELGKVISSIFNLEELLRAIVQNALNIMKSRRCSIVLVDEKTGQVYIRMGKGIGSGDEFVENLKVKAGGMVTEHVLKTREPLLVRDARNDERLNLAGSGGYRTDSFIAVPLIVNDRAIGVLSITEKESGEEFNESDVNLLTIFANQVVIAIENAKLYEKLVERERLEKELEIAHAIQMNMLPRTYPPLEGMGVTGISIPAKEVGGDYYDFIPVGESEIAVVIGDVSGKGVPAALMMVMIRSILRAKIMRGVLPAKIVSELNSLMLGEMDPRMFVTLFFAILDGKKKTISYTNAGHNYPLLFRARTGEVMSLEDGGLLMGMFEQPEYLEGKAQLESGDVILFYTDGVIEALNSNDEMYSYDRLVELVKGICHLPAEKIKEMVLDDIKKFTGTAPQYDDMTLIVIKVE